VEIGANMGEKVFFKQDLLEDLKNLGVTEGDLLNVKCSLKSIGMVDGGAATLVEALLEAVGKEGTIVTDSFISVFTERESVKNPLSDESSPSYAGALANAMLKHPEVCRSRHPVQKFAAIGLKARELTEAHNETSYAYNILKIMSENGGKNLKIGDDRKVVGVGTTHVAMGIIGFRQLRPVVGRHYIDRDGAKKFFPIDWAGLCADGLINFIPKYEENGNIISKGRVGNAEAKITYMEGTLKTELDLLNKDPFFFMCDKKDCVGCNLTWEIKKGSKVLFFIKMLLRGRFKQAIRVLGFFVIKHRYLPHESSNMPQNRR
jgi:aminoglycoside 3-N-acetyltransferase